MTRYAATSLAGVRDGVCRWFGGEYDESSRTYRNPQVAGLGTVRRSRPKVQDDAEYYLGAPSSGQLIGSTMLVHVDSGEEIRATFAGQFGGLKLIRSAVVLHVFLTSNASFAEDATDGFYELLDRIKDRLRADPCLGSGGFENGGFDAAEGGAPWLRWQMAAPVPNGEVTEAYATVEFIVRYYTEGGA